MRGIDIEYKIVAGDECWLVERDINFLLEEGYILHGGLILASGGRGVYRYAQAMIKED